MKRSFLAAVLIGTLIAGCGGGSKPTTAKTTATVAAKTPKTATTPKTSTTSTTASPTRTTPTKKPTKTATTPKPPPKPKKTSVHPHKTRTAPQTLPQLPPRKLHVKPVVPLSTANRSAACPAFKTDLKNFGQQSEATLTVRTLAEEHESYQDIKKYSHDLAEALPGLNTAFPQAKETVRQLEGAVKSFRSVLKMTGPHGNPTLLAAPAERVLRAGAALESLCSG
jgi:hypothetical protein